MRRFVRLVDTSCERCGKPLSTLSRSLFRQFDDLKAKRGILCSACTTPEEREQITRDQMAAFRGF